MDKLDCFKIGYFLVYKSDGKPFSKLIVDEQLREGIDGYNAEFTHVGICLGGKRSIDALIPRIRMIKDISKEFKGRFVRVVKPKIENYDDEKRKNVAIEALTRCNLPYGFFSLLWFKINDFIFRKRNKLANIGGYFCSYLSAASLQYYYPNFMNKPSENCLPGDFLDFNKFEIVWEGFVDDVKD